MSPQTRYTCRYGHTKVVPESPLDPSPSIRTGCDPCGTLREHRPVGTVYAAGWVQ